MVKGEISITKSFTFDSAHLLYGYNGACANMHGHTYKCEVTVSGIKNTIGMIVDFKDLKKALNESVMDVFDHKCINDVVSYNPTAENMVEDIAQRIGYALNLEHHVIKVKLWETPDSYATWECAE